MKTIQFILIFVCFGLSVGQAQTQTQAQTSENLPYRSLESFQSNAQMSDTLQYLEYNFCERESQYVGKTVADLIKDIKLPHGIVSHVGRMSTGGDSPIVITGIYVGIKPFSNEFNELIDYYVLIYFSDPPLADDFIKVFNREKDSGTMPSKTYDLIKDLKVSHVTSNPNIIMKRKKMQKAQENKESN